MKFHAMTGDVEARSRQGRDPQAVKRGIRQILNPPTPQTDQVMVKTDIGVEPGSIVPIIHLMDQPGPLQDPQGVIHGIGRHHGITTSDLPVEVLGGRVIVPLGQSLIDRRPLRRHLDAPCAKPPAHFFSPRFHMVPC